MKVTSESAVNILIGLTCIVMISVGALDLRARLLGESRTSSSTTVENVGAQAGASAARPAPVEDVSDLTIPSNAGIVKSSGTPQVALIEFSDFECPFCRNYATGPFREIQRDFVDTGKVEYVFVNFPREGLHEHAFAAATAFECAAQQQRPWEMHDKLFEKPTALAEQALFEQAQSVGLRVDVFKRCISGEAVSKVRAELALGDRAGIHGTPTFLVGQIRSNGEIRVVRRITGAVPYGIFKSELDTALAPRAAAARP